MKRRNTPRANFKNFIDQGIDECTRVRDDDYGAGVRLEGDRQRLGGFHVQVVGGFV